MRGYLKFLGIGLVIFSGLVCPATAAMRTVDGTVTYRERMALPAGARVEVKLLDVSLADAPAKEIARANVSGANPPIRFQLRYDDARIDPRMRYALQAQIRVNGRLWFISTTHIAFTGQESVDIPVQRVQSPAGNQGGAGAPVDGPHGRWLAEDIRGGGVLDRVQTVIDIGADGRLSGSGGCNRLAGQVKIKGQTITFSRVGSTMMACPPAVMDQERKFHDALAAARSWRVDPTRRKLALLDEAGQPLIVLARQ